MTNNICTSIKQSKKLIDLGLERSTSDMCYELAVAERNEYWDVPRAHFAYDEDELPAWSLQTLIDLLPTNIWIEEHGRREVYHLHIGYKGAAPNVQYVVSTHDTEWYPEGYRPVYYTPETATTWIDAVWFAMMWVLQNNYFKKS
jgi:hypothetical protein